MAKKVKDILLKLMNVVSVLIIVISIGALLTVVLTKPGQAPNFFGYSFFRVMTGSMEPAIPTNSLIVVKRTPAAELSEGDVITFYSRDPSLMGEPNTHRIISIEESQGKRIFHTKGDANNMADVYPTKEEDLIGRVVYSSYGLGSFVRLISNPLIFVPLILVPLAIMLIRSIVDSVSAAKKLAKEEEEKAVREALAALREKKAAEQNQDTDIAKAEASNAAEAEKRATADERAKTEEKTTSEEITTQPLYVATETQPEVRRVQTIMPEMNRAKWQERYGVRQKSYKRKQIQRGKWNRR